MEAIRKEAEQRKGLFKDLRVGNPLLYDDTDYEAVMKEMCIRDRYKSRRGFYKPRRGLYRPR